MSKPLMCHVVAGYPDREKCLQLMRGMCGLGIQAIEVQIPFSDPIADGETIMHANDVALAGGMTTEDSFELIRSARKQGVDCDIFIMSYLQKVRHLGLEAFCREAAKSGVKGLIIPDLPYDSPEYAELAGLTRNGKLELVPVLSQGMPEKRLKALLDAEPRSVYVTSQRGITGNKYNATEALERLVAAVKAGSDAAVMIGFGITTPQDVRDALKLGDIAVVGSAIINKLEATDSAAVLDYIGSLAGDA